MNDSNAPVANQTFTFRDSQDQDRWETSWTPVFGALTVVGATTYVGRYRIIGRSCQFQVQFSAVTSIESVAGTDYLNSPFAMAGLSGIAAMSNTNTNIAVGLCHVDVPTSRIYLPTQTASASVFLIAGWFEI